MVKSILFTQYLGLQLMDSAIKHDLGLVMPPTLINMPLHTPVLICLVYFLYNIKHYQPSIVWGSNSLIVFDVARPK